MIQDRKKTEERERRQKMGKYRSGRFIGRNTNI